MLNDDGKDLKVVTLKYDKFEDAKAREIAWKLKVAYHRKIEMALVDKDSKKDGKS